MAPKRSILSLALPKDAISLLTAAGYETLKDLENATTDGLAQDLHISPEIADQILALREPIGTIPSTFSITQSAAVLVQVSQKIPTGCSALDVLLRGGIQRGHILELSGPPGCPKNLAVTNVIQQFADLGDATIVIDCQNMMNRRFLMDLSRRNSSIRYSSISTLPQFILFISQLPTLLGTFPTNTLLVIDSISFLFQGAELSPASRTALLQKLKQILAKLTMSDRLTVLVTCQLATKLINSDGFPGTFDTGVQGVMIPHPGPAYLPSGKSWRVMFSPNSQTSGIMKLISSPHGEDDAGLVKQAYSLCRSPM